MQGIIQEGSFEGARQS